MAQKVPTQNLKEKSDNTTFNPQSVMIVKINIQVNISFKLKTKTAQHFYKYRLSTAL